MDQTLAFLADYHTGANRRFLEALSALGPEALAADRGSYYKSLKGLSAHLCGGELFILSFLRKALPGRPELGAPELGKELKPGTPPFASFEEEKAALPVFDEAFRALARNLGEEDLGRSIDVMGKTRSIRSLLASAFLHAAHHRAQASQILDEDKVANDFYAAIRDIEG